VRRFARQNGLSLAFGALFLVTLDAQALVGHADFNHQQVAHQAETVSLVRYVSSSSFWVDVMENWQSEYLQFTLVHPGHNEYNGEQFDHQEASLTLVQYAGRRTSGTGRCRTGSRSSSRSGRWSSCRSTCVSVGPRSPSRSGSRTPRRVRRAEKQPRR